MKDLTSENVRVARLGQARLASPLQKRGAPFVDESTRVLAACDTAQLRPYLQQGEPPPSFEAAGPRREIFFDPGELACGIVTCGGLCPGLNDVIRSIVLTLHYAYGVRKVYGFRYGYAGLTPDSSHRPLLLSPHEVSDVHQLGGTLLGSSRGPQDIGRMVNTLVAHKVGILFTIGGDGTLRGASAIAEEVARRELPISVIGIPKTIDNDLKWTTRSFGFPTAVEAAAVSITAAHVEACGADNGVGLVKLMGRHSGFIAAHATLSYADVNLCLVPEVPFDLEGDRGFLKALERRLELKDHAVVVVAEGAGQEVLQDPHNVERDASGNVKLKDVGVFLRDRITEHFSRIRMPATVRYIDPSYLIRSTPANAIDSEFCLVLGQHAVHAGMAGRTNMVVGFWNQHFTHVPISLATAGRKQLDAEGGVWHRVLEATGQLADMRG